LRGYRKHLKVVPKAKKNKIKQGSSTPVLETIPIVTKETT